MAASQPGSKGRFDEPILTAVETNDHGFSTGRETHGQHAQKLLQIGELAIDKNPQGLKSPGCRVDAPAVGGRMEPPSLVFSAAVNCFHNQARQISRPLDRLLPASGNDGPCDFCGFGFIAKPFQSLAEVALRNGGEKLGGRSAATTVHAQVERTIADVREAALRIIHLHAGHAQVGENRIDGFESLRGQKGRQARKVPLVQREGMAYRRQSFSSAGEVFPVQIQTDKTTLWADPPEQLHRMSGPAHGAVDNDLTRLRIEPGEHAFQENRPVFAHARASLPTTHGRQPC
jgi:hypothetical protein